MGSAAATLHRAATNTKQGCFLNRSFLQSGRLDPRFVVPMFPIQNQLMSGPVARDKRNSPYHHVDLRDYDNIKTNLTDEELVLTPTKDLNKFVKESGITREDVKKIKEKRRTLKNRGYAASCRVKREEEEKHLTAELGLLERDITELTGKCDDQTKKIEREKLCFNFRLNWAIKQKEIQIPSDLLDPASTAADTGLNDTN